MSRQKQVLLAVAAGLCVLALLVVAAGNTGVAIALAIDAVVVAGATAALGNGRLGRLRARWQGFHRWARRSLAAGALAAFIAITYLFSGGGVFHMVDRPTHRVVAYEGILTHARGNDFRLSEKVSIVPLGADEDEKPIIVPEQHRTLISAFKGPFRREVSFAPFGAATGLVRLDLDGDPINVAWDSDVPTKVKLEEFPTSSFRQAKGEVKTIEYAGDAQYSWTSTAPRDVRFMYQPRYHEFTSSIPKFDEAMDKAASNSPVAVGFWGFVAFGGSAFVWKKIKGRFKRRDPAPPAPPPA